MKFGLSDEQLVQIRAVLSNSPGVTEAVIFGSRAMGNYAEASDVDIALKGKVTASMAADVKSALEEDTYLPFFFDVIAYASIDAPKLKEHIDKRGATLWRAGWKEHRFSDFVDIAPKVSLRKGLDYSFVEMADLTKGQRYCAASVVKKFAGSGTKFQNADTLFARITPCLENGKICQVRNLSGGSGFGSTEFHVLRGKEGISDSDFVFYLSRYADVREFAEANLHGTSGRQRVPGEAFDTLLLNLPPLPEQRAIAAVLSSLDDKIDLLNRQIRSLESAAAVVFRQRFIENRNYTRDGVLGEMIATTTSGEWGKETPDDEYNRRAVCIRGTDIDDLRFGIPSRIPTRYVKGAKLEAISPRPGDLIMEISGGTEDQSTGRTLCIDKSLTSFFASPLIFSNFCRLIHPKEESFGYFLYFYCQWLYSQDEFFNFENGTSGIKNLDYKNLFSAHQVRIPGDMGVVRSFNADVKECFERIGLNRIEIRSLVRLRETLLPKLISGEVRVRA